MKILSEASFEKLANVDHDYALLQERHTRLSKAYRVLERRHQELLLELGLHGFEAEMKAAVPARPAKIVIRKAR